jgi:hypothetical protein
VEPCPIDLPISLCINESGVYANQLYTRKYLRDTSVTGRLGDMHINKDGSKTMNGDDQKIVHRWNHDSISFFNCPTERSSSRHLSSCKNNKSGWSFKV